MSKHLNFIHFYKRREKPFGKGSISPSIWGIPDYTWRWTMVKVTFLLNN